MSVLWDTVRPLGELPLGEAGRLLVSDCTHAGRRYLELDVRSGAADADGAVRVWRPGPRIIVPAEDTVELVELVELAGRQAARMVAGLGAAAADAAVGSLRTSARTLIAAFAAVRGGSGAVVLESNALMGPRDGRPAGWQVRNVIALPAGGVARFGQIVRLRSATSTAQRKVPAPRFRGGRSSG